jgi:hypothetical protein
MTNSRGSLNREIFKKLSSIVPHNSKDDKPYLIQLRNVCVIKTMLVSTKGKHLKTKFQIPFNGSEPQYSIFHKKEVDIIDMPKTYKVRKTFEYSESELSAFQMKQERTEFIENMEGGEFGDDMIVLSIIFKDANRYEMEIMEILEERTYKTLELTITETSSNKLLYNKKDLCIFDKHIHPVQKRKKIITMSDYEEIIFNETVVLGGW